MKTIEQRLKEIKRIAIGFFIVGIAMVIFFVINKGNKKSEDGQNGGYIEGQEIVAGEYEIDSKGNILRAVKSESDAEETDRTEYVESFDDIDFKLPYKRNNNALSAKEGVLAKLVYFLSDEWISDKSYYPDYSIIEEGLIVLFDPAEGQYGITDGKGQWIVEPSFYNWEGVLSSYEYLKEEGLILIKRGEDDALVDLEGNWILEPYTFYPFVHVYGSRIVFGINSEDYDEKGDQIIMCGVCDLNGNIIIEPKYYDIDCFAMQDERICTKDFAGEYRLFDFDGNDILNSGYKNIEIGYNKEPENKIFYIIQDNDGKFFTCDKDGNELSPEKYDGLTKIGNGRMIAEVDGKKGIIDSEGNAILEIKYKDIYKNKGNDNTEDVYTITTMDGEIGAFSLGDAMIMEPQGKGTTNKEYRYHYDYQNDVIYYDRGDGFYVVLREGKEPLQIECDGLSITSDGFILLYDKLAYGKQYYLMDPDGNMIYADGAKTIVEGYVDDKLYLIVEEQSDKGDIYKFISDKEVKFECLAKNMKVKPEKMEGIYPVCNEDGLFGVVNCKGELVLGYEYKDIEVEKRHNHDTDTERTMIIAKTVDDKYGIMNDKFEWIYEPQFSFVDVIGVDSFIVELSDGQVIQK
ncbi:hypothetical protein D6853_10660 [Butyrivibrio sp. X503]|uniref:WG repeat-containing protein n=1 Tax=Butyrivibrio sp. X503 TaxID=2364878 RepID=UPI000EAAAC07|nr:WG repeat-containing protein [Butyrivibrio sp. X503]RKM55185.1 hypothetical protein D6853_10660 [Butyrivibrio sp. X503]